MARAAGEEIKEMCEEEKGIKCLSPSDGIGSEGSCKRSYSLPTFLSLSPFKR